MDLSEGVEAEEEDKGTEEGVVEVLLGSIEGAVEREDDCAAVDEDTVVEDTVVAPSIADGVPKVAIMDIQPVKESKSINCLLCGLSGLRNSWFLKRHHDQMHSVAIKCNICENFTSLKPY